MHTQMYQLGTLVLHNLFNLNFFIMPAFPRRNCFSSPRSSILITDVRQVEEVHNGVSVKKEIVVQVTPEEFHKEHPIIKESYSLNEQLSAGVPLKEVPTSSLLDSSDPLDYPIDVESEVDILKGLEETDENN